MSSRVAALLTHVRENAENRPGVYRMLGPSGEVLYVGKSVRVRSRLLSYFRADAREKAGEIIAHAHQVEWEHQPSEFAALLRELRLIKLHRPPYNVEHKRDRDHCFIHLTREAVPRLHVVGRVTGASGDYFGPFHGHGAVSEVVRAVSDLLELRDCAADTPMRLADQGQLFPLKLEPLCMRGQLARCLAPCAGRCTRAEYHAHVAQARAFLEGTSDAPLLLLHERMAQAARRLQFEYAAELRDKAERLDALRGWIVRLGGTMKRLSFVYTVPGHDGEDRVYLLRRGIVRDELPAPRTAAERRALDARTRALFDRPEPETLALRAHEAQEVMLVARWFSLHPEEFERTVAAKPSTTSGDASPT
ncbi:GIY-YIG nuclease family protein [Myxococcus sp. K15C18031901]|uniref:GIY-YIG nuclease family protein n=1 Tax=Myxococcus dinghuensis TaxID=2906761 RepID=UPI0020A76C2B|nr:GIY-YIG nuclease family protein [Myxococcus dinghuensis]MCP3104690.1 GIY-YIG nuclease family protein [Myxococcus dinghuensis]